MLAPPLDIFHTRTLRDGATPLHWAVAGANSREFGIGGHVHVCQYLLEHVPPKHLRDYVNLLTKDGNSALMWAAWSGTLDTVKLLVRHRAEINHANLN
jgi:ankyrin repeat protein